MVLAKLNKSKQGICGFTIKNHTKDIVCAAISVLTLNTVNSIEALTDAKFSVEANDKGGFLQFTLLESDTNGYATILLAAMELGLLGISDEYKNKIRIEYEEV